MDKSKVSKGNKLNNKVAKGTAKGIGRRKALAATLKSAMTGGV